jgi:hypothetical protein
VRVREQLFAEMRTYKAESVPREYEQLMRGVLCLTGRRRKELPTWETIKKALSRELYDEMLELDPTSESTKLDLAGLDLACPHLAWLDLTLTWHEEGGGLASWVARGGRWVGIMGGTRRAVGWHRSQHVDRAADSACVL